MKFEVLYHFSLGPIHVIETKRPDLPPGSSPQEIYQWILIEDQKAHLLNFVSMSLNPQQRVFQEGMIGFDLNSCSGRLLEKDLDLTRQEKMGESLRKLIEECLRVKEKGP